MRGKPFTKEEQDNILALHAEGYSYYKIGIILEVLPNKVRYFLSTPDERRRISGKSNSYSKRTAEARRVYANERYKTDAKYRAIKKQESNTYYHTVLKPAREYIKNNKLTQL